jgi:hypothetical protein
MKNKYKQMKRIFILLITVITLCSCREQIERILNRQNNKLVFFETKYSYKYKSDKLIHKTEKSYTLVNNKIKDSTFYITEFKYNDRGLLIKEDLLSADLSWQIIYGYNKQDSLNSYMKINGKGDTVSIDKYAIFPDGNKTIYNRELLVNQNNKSRTTYDTIYTISEYIYRGNLCTSVNDYNLKGELYRIIDLKYNDKSLLQEKHHYSYVNNLKLPSGKKFYEYSKSDYRPDTYYVNSSNDTTLFRVNEFMAGELIKTLELNTYDDVYIECEYNNGLKILSKRYDLYRNEYVYVTLYEYNNKRELIKEISHFESVSTGF